MREVYLPGVRMAHFGKHMDESVRELGREVAAAIDDAGVEKVTIQTAAVGNSAWGLMEEQASIRGEVILRSMGIDRIPVMNVENACASGSTAFHLCRSQVAAGMYDVALALGVERLDSEDRAKVMTGFIGGTDVEQTMRMPAELMTNGDVPSNPRTVFMDIYAREVLKHMEKYGTTRRHLAAVCARNHHRTMNSLSQYRNDYTIEEVPAEREIAFPLTRPMCSPISDGAAAAVLCSKNFLKKAVAPRPVGVSASVIGSGGDPGPGYVHTARRLSDCAYRGAGLGPEDTDVAEIHDVTACAELALYDHLGLCEYGEGGPLAGSGATAPGGRIPTNTNGGLESKGHPVGATGPGQTTEVVWQLRGDAGARQVRGARVGLTQNERRDRAGGSRDVYTHIHPIAGSNVGITRDGWPA